MCNLKLPGLLLYDERGVGEIRRNMGGEVATLAKGGVIVEVEELSLYKERRDRCEGK